MPLLDLKILKNQKGFSLIELLISSSIAVLTALAAAMALLHVTKANFLAHYTAEEWANAESAKQILPGYLGQAINVDWTTGNINNINAGRGRIQIFQSGYNGPTPQAIPTTIGAFLREAGHPSLGNPGSDLRATALYFRNPSLLTSGELMISTSPVGFGNVQLSSDQPAVRFDSIVELEIRPGGFTSGNGDPIRVARIKMITRRFLSTQNDQWRWCPESQLAITPACNTSAKYVDEVKYINIPFANNSIATHFGGDEFLYGDLYFYGIGVPK